MGCQFSAICKVVAQPVGNHLFPVNAVRRLRRRSRRNFVYAAGGPLDRLRMKLAQEPSIRGGKVGDDDDDESD
jgi:hypothetical protein